MASLKALRRTAWLRRQVPDGESVADHTFGVVYWAWYVITSQAPDADPCRVLQMALVHDLHEARLGDLDAIQQALLGNDAIRQGELRAIRELVDEMPGQLGIVYAGLMAEFLAGETEAAKIVADCDYIDFLSTLLAYLPTGNQQVSALARDLHPYRVKSNVARPIIDDLLIQIAQRVQNKGMT